jgi:hypothetical protein
MVAEDRSFGLRDAYDALRFVRSPKAVLSGLLGSSPSKWILNEPSAAPTSDVQRSDARACVEAMCLAQRELKAELFCADGGVDYAQLAERAPWQKLNRLSISLRGIDPTALAGDAERTAFWVNLYNVLALHGVVARGVKRSVMEFPDFFATVSYCVAGIDCSLDDIENGILRRNAVAPAAKKPPFSADDPRLAWAPTEVDARIHMALVCASTSCPALRFYDATDLSQQLDDAVRAYVESSVRVGTSDNTLWLSPIFRFYSVDFGGRRGIVAFIKRYADGALARRLEQGSDWRLRYDRYDWSLNGPAGHG